MKKLSLFLALMLLFSSIGLTTFAQEAQLSPRFSSYDEVNEAITVIPSTDSQAELGYLKGITAILEVDGEPIKLTPIEYNILLLLVKNAGKVFSIDQIYEAIWNEEAIGADNTVAVHIRHIREKIEINPREPRYLKVVWGVGYKIEKQ